MLLGQSVSSGLGLVVLVLGNLDLFFQFANEFLAGLDFVSSIAIRCTHVGQGNIFNLDVSSWNLYPYTYRESARALRLSV